jgi:hypothetical protein
VNQEEGEYEYVSDHQSGKEGKAEAHIEPAVLYQPLWAEAGEGSGEGGGGESEGFRIPVAGGCPSTSDPCYKHIRHHSGRANEGSACGRRSGCGGGGGSGSACEFVAGGLGGIAGGAIGTVAGGPPGGMLGGAVGGWAASKVCG